MLAKNGFLFQNLTDADSASLFFFVFVNFCVLLMKNCRKHSF